MTGSRLAEAYVDLLADTGISHGLIGPREAPRLWDRHVLNSAVVHPVFDHDSVVADIGSGAGLPGIPLAIVRPDLRLVLIEPLLRRTVWLTSTVAELGLTNVEVRRGRAESLWGQDRFHHITARAVARTGELARIGLPLLDAGGSLHALKGESAVTELAEDADELRSLGASSMGHRAVWSRSGRPGDRRRQHPRRLPYRPGPARTRPFRCSGRPRPASAGSPAPPVAGVQVARRRLGVATSNRRG